MKQPPRSASARAAASAAHADKLKIDLARRAELGEARRMRTKASLLQAALSVLGHEGGRFATVDDIIGKAGVSRGTFYNHFSGREQFFEAVAYQLSHEFNQALEESLDGNRDPAVRGATWIRRYLRRVRADAAWGWALVNVSLNGPHLMGQETYDVARHNIAAGCATKLFKAPNLDAALDMALGCVLASALTILRGPTKADHPEATAYFVLLALGVPEAQAKRFVSQPLPGV